jgi:hypothetical protein
LVAQLVWDQWVGGSNPLSPTTFEETCFLKAGFFSSGVSQLTLLFIRDIPLQACLSQETFILLINKA